MVYLPDLMSWAVRACSHVVADEAPSVNANAATPAEAAAANPQLAHFIATSSIADLLGIDKVAFDRRRSTKELDTLADESVPNVRLIQDLGKLSSSTWETDNVAVAPLALTDPEKPATHAHGRDGAEVVALVPAAVRFEDCVISAQVRA
jgi:hypothetical protein